jgi:type I restriction enzyme M protein
MRSATTLNPSSQIIQAMSKSDLLSVLDKCHQILWNGGKLSPQNAFNELCKIISLKLIDEQNQISKRYEAPLLRQRYEQYQQKHPHIFDETLKVSDSILESIIEQLHDLRFLEADLDVAGLAFERFMDNFFKGDLGQYFTPREIVKFMVEMLQPSATDRILDPCCGTGGFPLHALDFVRKNNSSIRNHSKNYWGIEINGELTRIARMNMMLHGVESSNILLADSLSFDLKNLFGTFDLILTNPPFGAKTDISHLHHFELARGKNSQKTEILFIEQIWNFLKEGTGKAAVVLPDGILTNPSTQYVRDWLVNKFEVLSVVKLPTEAFMLYGASVSSSIVFLRKLNQKEIDANSQVVMAIPNTIGYDATGRANENQLHKIAEAFHDRKSQKQFDKECDLFFISLKQILADGRLDPKYYHPERLGVIQEILTCKKNASARLEEIASFVKDQADTAEDDYYVGLANIQSNTGEFISDSSEDKVPSGIRFEAGDILFSRLRPILNKVHLAEKNGICSPEFIVIRNNKPSIIDTRYLVEILRSRLALIQVKHMIAGNTHPRIAKEDLGLLVLPLPSIKEQEILMDRLAEAKKQTVSLRQKAALIQEKAFAEFQKAIEPSSSFIGNQRL